MVQFENSFVVWHLIALDSKGFQNCTTKQRSADENSSIKYLKKKWNMWLKIHRLSVEIFNGNRMKREKDC